MLLQPDNSMHVILKNYDGNFLSFLIIIFAVPLFIATVILAINMNGVFVVTLVLLAAVIYWCVYHYKDTTKFIFAKDIFIVLEGMYQIQTCQVRYKDIVRTEKVTIAGSAYQGSEIGNDTVNHPNYELYLHTRNECLLVTKHVGPNGQDFLDKMIREKMAAC